MSDTVNDLRKYLRYDHQARVKAIKAHFAKKAKS